MGVPLGLGLAAIRCALEPLASVDWMFPPFESFLIVAIVTGIGLVGGCLPAWRAVRTDPIEILRYE
jgi:ABC-type antimicrobial peptide transport system permease subunit